jgi:hypothetical protein
MTRILGFDDFVPSADARSTAERPLGGILMAVDPEVQRQLQEQRRLVQYVEERFVHFIDPDENLLH